MRYAITIAAERETPYIRRIRININISYTHATRQSKSGDYEGDWMKVDRRGCELTC
jgi:hypothetical protein